MNIHKGWAFPRGIYSEVHSPITTPEIICVMALTLQPIRGCPQHSGETGTRLLSAIHRRLLSRFFLREGGRLYTGYCSNCLCVNVYCVSREALWARASTCIQGHKHWHRQDNVQEFCARKMPQFGIWILYANLPLALHFRMPLCFVFASFILNGSREIQHLC